MTNTQHQLLAINTDITSILEQMAIQPNVPLWVQLLPAPNADGAIVGRDGRSWQLPNPQSLVDAFIANNADLPIDIEHSTELLAKKGNPAPAVAWIKALEVRNNEVWGLVQWNDEGQWLVAAKSYRYLSPVFIYDTQTETIVMLTSAALTNQPNLQLTALNQKVTQPKEAITMNEKAALMTMLTTALALNASANENSIIDKINELTATNKQLSDELAALKSSTDLVPTATHQLALNRADEAEAKLAEIAKNQHQSQVEAAIDKAMEDKKIAHANREHYLALCSTKQGFEQVQVLLKHSPQLVADSNSLDNQSPTKPTALNAEQSHMAAQFGNSADELNLHANQGV